MQITLLQSSLQSCCHVVLHHGAPTGPDLANFGANISTWTIPYASCLNRNNIISHTLVGFVKHKTLLWISFHYLARFLYLEMFKSTEITLTYQSCNNVTPGVPLVRDKVCHGFPGYSFLRRRSDVWLLTHTIARHSAVRLAVILDDEGASHICRVRHCSSWNFFEALLL